ncbi:hypothetical protein [Microvirga sp. Mcv34]|uniref:hypothetical protein n=1 Tax=Microvirga sp. Mcv34 TaxID=2926016 RepID=UPI0021C5A907|nr:hypothetical protein [Microvirga sp. Mcv34]
MSMLDAHSTQIRDLERDNKQLRKSLEESHKIIRAYEDARHEWGGQQYVEAIAKLLWHRFAPAQHIGWEDEPNKAEYRLAAADALAVVAGKIEVLPVRSALHQPNKEDNAPCAWAGGNDTNYCRICGQEYDYRTAERPPCPRALHQPNKEESR